MKKIYDEKIGNNVEIVKKKGFFYHVSFQPRVFTKNAQMNILVRCYGMIYIYIPYILYMYIYVCVFICEPNGLICPPPRQLRPILFTPIYPAIVFIIYMY